MSIKRPSPDPQPARAAKRTILLFVGIAAVALAAFGCGRPDKKESNKTAAPKTVTPSIPAKTIAPKTDGKEIATATSNKGSAPAPSKTPSAESAAGGTFSGTITVTGNVPDLPLLVTKGDKKVKDPEVCGVHDILDESLQVNRGANNALAGVFVYLVKAPTGSSGDIPQEPVVIDQVGCHFIPHTSIVRVGQPVSVLSDDSTPHNVHTDPKRNSPFNQTIPPKDRKGVTISYERAELEPVLIKCDIHAWMRGYQLPLDHPYAAITDANGRFVIDNVPPGAHSFRIWHERANVLDRAYKVEIQSGKTVDVQISYPIDKLMIAK